MSDTLLETERLILRRFRDSDLGPCLEHLNTPAVRAHIGGVVPADEAEAKFARDKNSWTDEGGGWLAVERKADGEFLGYCGFGTINADSAPEDLRGAMQIGWTLRADCWGNGYATEAARGLLPLIFDRFDCPILYSQTSEVNRGSWRVMERLGMERTMQLDYDDPAYPPEENPTKVYALTREAWQTRRDD